MRLAVPAKAQPVFTSTPCLTFQFQIEIFICWCSKGLLAWLICLFNFLLVLSSFISFFFCLRFCRFSFVTSFLQILCSIYLLLLVHFIIASKHLSHCYDYLHCCLCRYCFVAGIISVLVSLPADSAHSQAYFVFKKKKQFFFIFVQICKDSFILLYAVWTEAFIHCHSQFVYLRIVSVKREGKWRIQL